MGCDIHGFVEVRFYEGDPMVWDAVITDELTDRWYYLFAHFFGVRNSFDVKPHWPYRGIPENLSYGTQGKLYSESKSYSDENNEPDPDWHSMSWVGWWELKPLLETDLKFAISSDHGDNQKYKIFFKFLEILGNEYGDNNVRWVVWFDN